MEESHAKLRDRLCLEDRLSAARGLYLQGSACCSEARVLFKCFPFGECGNPATLVVWRFQSSIVNTGNIAGFAYSYNLFVFRSPCYLIAYSIIKIEPGFLADLDDRGCFT